jgi:Ni,Fe-hydrogenase III large subunit
VSYRADAHDHYRDAIAEGGARGARFASLYASHDPAGAVVRTVLHEPGGGLRIETVPVRDGRVPSIVDLMGAAEWSERESHDLHGVSFDGHEPLRPLVDHAATLAEWTVPVRGADVYHAAVGPIHAGIIESGHFRFHVVGDRILHLDARLFYKHRGLERAAVGSSLDEGIAYAARACAACAVTNRVAYAHAAEQLRGLRPDAEVARARTILLELERLWSHLNDIAAICSGVGMAAGNQRYSALSEDARRLNAALSGHRMLFDSVHVGESRLSLDAAQCADARETLARMQADATRAWRSLLFNASFQDRLVGVGVLDTTAALTLGAVGPAARASGLADDARTAQDGWLSYDGLSPALGTRATGDVRARFEQRELELHQTFSLLDDLLARPLAPASCDKTGAGAEIAASRVESPRGATVCVLERDGERVARLRLHTGSYANWPVLASVAPGELLPDFPLINKSFELCYACADR